MVARLALVFICASSVAQSANAQSRIIASEDCSKMDPAYVVPVVDREGFVYIVGQLTCTMLDSKPMVVGGLKATRSTHTMVIEVMGPSVHMRNSGVITYEGGDKTFEQVTGTHDAKTGKDVLKWWYTGGTGRFSGIKGGGTAICTPKPKAAGEADAGATCEIKGTYRLPTPKST